MISEFAHVSPNAIIGNNVTIKAGVIIYDNVIIGDNNYIGENTIIGAPPQVRRGYKQGKVIIGSDNTIREMVSIQSPSEGVTSIGDDCFIMEKVHIAHDCIIKDHVTIATGTVLAGGVNISNYATLGVNVGVHQRIIIGEIAMIGMGAIVTKDVPDCKTVANKYRAEVIGWNRNGMRKYLTKDEINSII